MVEYNTTVEPVKLLAAILFSDSKDLQTTFSKLETLFSKIDFKGVALPFDESSYYDDEMGDGLKRMMVSFETLVSPEILADAKHLTHHLEDEIAQEQKRVVNIDIGYLDMFKFVLASFKSRSNKIYLGKNIWADMIMYFESGTFQPFVWSFPDFKSGKYNDDLKEIRRLFKPQLKKWIENERK